MQTIYYTTNNFVRHRENLIDLEEYRRRLSMAQAGSLAPQPRENYELQENWEEQEQPALRLLTLSREEARACRRERRERRAMVLDLCASASVLVMTLAFTLHILLG